MARRVRVLGAACTVLAVVLAVAGTARAQTNPHLSWARPFAIDLDENATPGGVTCPSVKLCLAYDNAGRVLVSTHPTAGPSTWKVHLVAPDQIALRGLICPSVSLCVAYRGGAIFASTHPGARSPHWTRVATTTSDLIELTCPTASLCVGNSGIEFADNRNVIASTHPGRPGTWKRMSVQDSAPTEDCVHYGEVPCDEHWLGAMSCTAPSLCVAIDQAGQAVASRDPAGGASTWHVVHSDPHTPDVGLNSITCTSGSFCAGVDTCTDACPFGVGDDRFVASGDPTAGGSAWRTGRTIATQPYVPTVTPVLACVSRSLCLATDTTGTFAMTTKPLAANPGWRPVGLGGTFMTFGCAGHGWCFALDGYGGIYSSRNPAGGAKQWSLAHPDKAFVQQGPIHNRIAPHVSCPSTRFCITVDPKGRILRGTV